jgi:PilZ domain
MQPARSAIPTRFSIRSFRRFPVRCRAYYAHDNERGTGTVWNLSLTGWRVDGTLTVRPGTVLSLWIIPPNNAPTVFVDRATVRWSRGLEFGMETTAIQDQEAARLKHLVESFV